MPKFKFEAHKLESILEEYAKIREVEIPQAVLINARLLAKELARRTQPFGTDDTAGKTRVGNDIGKVIKGDEHLDQMIDKVKTAKIKARLESLLRAKNYNAIKKVFQRIGFLNKYGDMEIVSSVATHHKQARDAKTGRTRSTGSLKVSPSDLQTYINDTMTRVGISKAGWAVAADALPPTVANRRSSYDFPPFVKKAMDKSSGSAQDNTSNISNPTVTLTNGVPWADRICPTSEQVGAVSVVIAKMKTQMTKILKARKKAEEVAD